MMLRGCVYLFTAVECEMIFLMIEFIAEPKSGRVFVTRSIVRLADAGPDGVLRPDGLARMLQDVATDDWSQVAGDADDTWLVRRTAVRRVGGTWPVLGALVELRTFCSGTGAAWAERRTDVLVQGQTVLQSAALWVPVDPSGRPRRVSAVFHEVYGEAAAGRKVPGRVPGPPEPSDAARVQPWPIRRSDLDVVGHVNNAVAWEAIVEVAGGVVDEAMVTHFGPLHYEQEVLLVDEPGQLWLMVDGEAAVTATWSSQSDS